METNSNVDQRWDPGKQGASRNACSIRSLNRGSSGSPQPSDDELLPSGSSSRVWRNQSPIGNQERGHQDRRDRSRHTRIIPTSGIRRLLGIDEALTADVDRARIDQGGIGLNLNPAVTGIPNTETAVCRLEAAATGLVASVQGRLSHADAHKGAVDLNLGRGEGFEALMSRIRTIKPSFFRSLTVAELAKPTRLTFIGLWTYVDNEDMALTTFGSSKLNFGQLDDDRSTVDVESDMKSLSDQGLIERYAVGDRTYFRIPSWSEHQVISHPRPSSLPAPNAIQDRSRGLPGEVPDASVLKGREGKGREPRKRSAPLASFESDFDEMWKVYPRSIDRAKTLKAYVARRRAGASSVDLMRGSQTITPFTVAASDPKFVKHGATFYGPDEPWREYLNPPRSSQPRWSAPDLLASQGGTDGRTARPRSRTLHCGGLPFPDSIPGLIATLDPSDFYDNGLAKLDSDRGALSGRWRRRPCTPRSLMPTPATAGSTIPGF